ncbi:N,N-dimethylformamidase [Kaistia algarum]|uniref:N,N-dimethylformamidase beta subunit family domain-containing protein n=1 Tax=Kaistia algarum TaxID=2083279 RepID=UPI000CE836AE|nr:N,N-dimethylformamidase beta subunit family domain-containing protein [Kaistia algarum]MCX5512620.1 N,N-dimethylformamidase [Kaistia algarum]PPE81862.1 N,N-dimethylformamidase [Kaistia algarum]
MLKIVGYPDRYSVAPGETIAFKLSVEEGASFDARIVRVVNGDCNPEGPGLEFRHVPTDADGRHAALVQRVDAGSYMIAEGVPPLAEKPFTFCAFIWPTLPTRPDQTLAAQWDSATQSGFRIVIAGGRTGIVVGDGKGGISTAFVDGVMIPRRWYHLVISLDPASGDVTIAQRPFIAYAKTQDAGVFSGRLDVRPAALAAPFLLAGTVEKDGSVDRHYDGKIDSPTLLAGQHGPEDHLRLLQAHMPQELATSVVARWDFSRGIDTAAATDVGPSLLHGRLEQLPTRGMKGWNWTGEEHAWPRKPEQYGAVHFHHDDVYDAAWKTSVEVRLPDDMPSGAYALHAVCGDSDETATREAYIAFFVRPPRAKAARGKRPKVLLLAPTMSYLAYANHGEHITARGAERQMGRLLTFGHADLYMYDHAELGGSLYDTHADGSGVNYSSRLRPNLNFSPRYHSWLGGPGSALYQYNADTHLFAWLDRKGVDYDVVTDEDLHEDGYELLAEYPIVLTGTHPEYHSTAMWDAMKAWVDRGGRLMYLGANGWYWRIAFNKSLPGVIEVRRAEDGTRTWEQEPGEYHHSFTGEYGGLWRRLGRAPNVMCGIGFIAQGFDMSSYYRRAPDADNPRVGFIFKDVPDEIIGNFGLVGGGAAGIELDCISLPLGSPPNILRLASSDGHSSMMMLTNEEFSIVLPNLGGDQNERVHADLTFYETPAGGAVFGTGSIAWCGSLLPNGGDNNVSRITWNVLERFLDETPF